MRLWDISPGYLNRQSLLGEHRELHAIQSIFHHRRRGYANHPETRRWRARGWALAQRHRLLAAEMALRGYRDQTPVRLRSNPGIWPDCYVDDPWEQLQILQAKYRGRQGGRIPLPSHVKELWMHHKYSVLARDEALYRRLGPKVARMRAREDLTPLALTVTELLRQPPPIGGLKNALWHMWGHVSRNVPRAEPARDPWNWTPGRLLREIQRRAWLDSNAYLLASTALGELAAWIPVTTLSQEDRCRARRTEQRQPDGEKRKGNPADGTPTSF